MNTRRIINLFRAYFIEHKKMLLICSLAVFMVDALDLTFLNGAEISALTWFIPFWVAGTFFQTSLKRNNSAHFFNLPVTAAEKFCNAVIILLILTFAVQALYYAGSSVGYYGLRPLLNPDAHSLRFEVGLVGRSLFDSWDWELCLVYFTGIFTFLFGSIYFKKHAFWKTLVCGIGFIFVFVVFYGKLLRFIAFGTDKLGLLYPFEIISSVELSHTSFWHGFDILSIALILFFLSLTYLRLKETEV